MCKDKQTPQPRGTTQTVQLLGKYSGDLHNLYRAIYIANIKAVNGRYNEENKTLPKYTKLVPWYTENGIGSNKLKEACYIFDSYMYQLSEDPIYGSPVYNALYDIYKLLALLLAKSLHREDIESRRASW